MEHLIKDITKRASPGVINLDETDNQLPDRRSSTSLEEDMYPEAGLNPSGECSETVRPKSDRETKNPNNLVYLNVYDLDDQFVSVNNALSTFYTGAFHAGIECYGMEYCYGMTEEKRSGVYWHRPKQNPVHIYRQTHVLGECHMSKEAFQRLVESKIDTWHGNEYHLFRRNCISFCEDLARDLNVLDNFPSYVSSLMNSATKAANGYTAVSNFLQSATQGYVSTVDTIGDEIVDGISNATTQVSKGLQVFGDGLRNAIPGFFSMTFPDSDDEYDDFPEPSAPSIPSQMSSVPPDVEAILSVPSDAREMDKTIGSLMTQLQEHVLPTKESKTETESSSMKTIDN